MAAGLIAAIAWAAPSSASAGLVFTLRPNAASYQTGTTGNYFDVFVQRDGASDLSIAMSSYQVKLTNVPTNAGITFTSVAETGSVGAGYPFAGGPTPSPATSTAGGVQTVTYGDSGPPVPFSSTLGTKYQLGRLFFDIANLPPTVPNQTFSVTFDPSGTSAGSVDSGAAFPKTFTGAAISVINPAAAPEPSSLVLLALCGFGGLGYRLRKRGATAA